MYRKTTKVRRRLGRPVKTADIKKNTHTQTRAERSKSQITERAIGWLVFFGEPNAEVD